MPNKMHSNLESALLFIDNHPRKSEPNHLKAIKSNLILFLPIIPKIRWGIPGQKGKKNPHNFHPIISLWISWK